MWSRYSKTFKALLLAGAVLAPAITLALLGLRAYRAETLLLRDRFKQDQAAIVRLVSGRLSEAAHKALKDLEGRCSAGEPDATLESRFRDAHPLAQHIFMVRRRSLVYPHAGSFDIDRSWDASRSFATGHLVSELDVKNYVSRLRQSRRLAGLVARGIRAESGGKLARAHLLYKQASRGGASDPAAQALLGLARVERRQGRGESALGRYRQLRRRFEWRHDREGVSYVLLADAGIAEVDASRRVAHLKEIHERLLQGAYFTSGSSRRFYLRWVVGQLQQITAPAARTELGKLRRITAHIFASERFGALLMRHGVVDLEQLATDRISSVALDRRTILVLRRRGEVVVGYSLDEGYLRHQVATHEQEVISQEGEVRLRLLRVGQAPAKSDRRVIYSTALDPPLSHWTLATLMPATDPMKVMERQGGLRRLGLVVGLISVLLVGLLLTYRGVRRESELARLKSDFASNVSHELKTPLTSIRMYAEMLQQGIATTAQDRSRYHNVIVREAERLGRLIANVLDFSKIERGIRSYDLKPEDLRAMTEEAVEAFSRLSEGEFTIRFEPNGVQQALVRADREAAIQSVLNLLSNAAKYSPDSVEIEVELTDRDGEVGVVVRDKGIGIPSNEQKRIFDDFYRAPGARQVGVEGTGLGLALVRRHMKACGGRVEVQSTPGKGSRFTIWFTKEQPRQEQDVDVKDSDH